MIEIENVEAKVSRAMTLEVVANSLGYSEEQFIAKLKEAGMLDEHGVPSEGKGQGLGYHQEIKNIVWVYNVPDFVRAFEFWAENS